MDHPDDEQDQSRDAQQVEVTEEGATQGMAALLDEESLSYRSIRRGEFVEGIVVGMARDGALVHIGAKSEGIIPSQELQAAEASGEPINTGDEIVAQVVQPEDDEGRAVLSVERAKLERGWRLLKRAFETGEAFEAPVLGYNKGGLIVTVHGIRGFIPTSQLAGIRPEPGQENLIEARLQPFVGETLRLKVIELNRRRNRLILSERVAVQEIRARERERLLEELEPGQIRRGRVTSLAAFGAFINLGGADGLVHLSELSWDRVKHPSEVLNVGDEVDVYVMSVDQETKRIGLSLRRAQPEPWALVTQKYHPGDLVEATVTKLTTFGAFARVESGVEGLIHISELSDRRIAHPREVVREGDKVTVRIVRFDPERRRLALSLKQAQAVQLPRMERGERQPTEEERLLEQYRESGVENRIPGLEQTANRLANAAPSKEESDNARDALIAP